MEAKVRIDNLYFQMSTSDSRGHDHSSAPVLSTVWLKLSLLSLSRLLPSLAPASLVRTSPSSPGPDMEDVTYLMDMDGEGLCFHQIYKEKQTDNN